MAQQVMIRGERSSNAAAARIWSPETPLC